MSLECQSTKQTDLESPLYRQYLGCKELVALVFKLQKELQNNHVLKGSGPGIQKGGE